MEDVLTFWVEPSHTFVLLTPTEVLVLLPDGNWTRTPLGAPQDLATKAQALAYKRLVIDHIESRLDLSKAKRDLAAADLKYELDRIAPPETIWHRKGGEGCL